MQELTYLNLRENLKLLLAMQGIPYIHDAKKELNAINKFTMDGNTPDYVIELIGKLIEIKRHPKLGKELFWKGCAINLSDAYSYRVKIETVYPTITTTIRQSVATDCPVGCNPLSNTTPWETFLQWSKQLTPTSRDQIAKMMAVMDEKLIVITGTPDDNLARLITNYWSNLGLGVVFKINKGNKQ